jgi:hypothetical protein
LKSAAILGVYAAAVGEEKEIRMNSVDDIGTLAFPPLLLADLILSRLPIGFFVAAALVSPATYVNRSIQLAGDSLAVPSIRAAYARAEGRPVKEIAQWPIPRFLIELLPAEIKGMFRYECKADLVELRKENGGLKSFETWLREAEKED